MNTSSSQSSQSSVDPRVDDYLTNRLDPTQLQQFELELIGSPSLQAQLRQAYVLQQLLHEQAQALPRSKHRHHPLALALAAGLGALAVGLPAAWWMQRSQSAQLALAQSHAELEQRLRGLASVQLGLPSLRLGNTRSNGDQSLPLLRQSEAWRWVRLTVPADIVDIQPGADLQLRLEGPGAEVNWQGHGADWQLEGNEYVLLLPLVNLSPGRHELVLQQPGHEAQRLAFEVGAED